MADQLLCERPVDIAFCRAYYDDVAELCDADLAARARAATDTSLPLNPTEFLHQVIGRRLLPDDFDWRAYARSTADPSLSDAWRAILHYLRRGRPDATDSEWPFDAALYRELHAPDDHAASDAELAAAWRAARGARLGCWQQVAQAGGFATLEWRHHFDAAAYVSANGLSGRIANDTQALVHFVTEGCRALLPLSTERAFDPAFLRELTGTGDDLSDAELYREWVQTGLPAGTPPNEAALLRGLDLELTELPPGFDWAAYVRDRPALAPDHRRKWGALRHLVRHGVVEAGALPLAAGAAWRLLVAIARRAARQGDVPRAMRIIDRCLLFGPPSPEDLQSVGEIAHLDGRFARALHAFTEVRTAGAANLLTFLRGGECALELGEPAQALDWALAGLTAYPRSDHLDRLLLRAQTAQYDAIVARHVAAMAAARESSIVADLTQLYDTILSGYRQADATAELPPAAPVSGRKLRVVMLANVDLPQCTFYRVTQKQQQLLSATCEITIVERDRWEEFFTACATADIAIFYRLHASVPVLRCIAFCEANAIPTCYEVDDLVFDHAHFPDTLRSYDGAITAQQHFELGCGVALVRFALQACDYGIASTDALRERMAPLVRRRRAITHRNCMPTDVRAIADRLRPREPARADETVVIFYGSATRAHGADYRELVEPALLRLMGENAAVCFLACGHVDVARLAAAFPDRVEYVAFQSDRAAYARLLTAADINLAMVNANPFNDCKSDIKWLEAAMLGVPTVASDVAGMREIAVAPADLLVCAPDADAWYAALRALAGDARHRHALGAHARRTVFARLDPTEAGAALERQLRGFIAAGAVTSITPSPARPARVLVVNVFYPPQSIGGATRVVADHVAALREHHAQHVAAAVLCGNAEESPPYRLTSYLHGGTRVWSIGTACRDSMDWLEDDPGVTPLFGAVLDAFVPDLVHFHCIQRLGAGIVEATAARGIPYVITAHDAWWISDHQFLLDETGRPCLPWQPEHFACARNPRSRSASLGRRRRLRACLDGAASVNTVSRSFADLYEKAGAGAVRAIPNGIPLLPPLEPTPRPPGRLRLGHFGGTGPAKGLHLLRHALSRQALASLELVAVDDTIGHGATRRERWGATEVSWVGRLPQHRIGALFGRIDVLVAPSIWPESFGLVVREALAYGKWAIAADRGALAEPIVPGENGFVFDPDDPDALAALLRSLNAASERFANRPAALPRQRGALEQTADYVALYRDILGMTDAHSPAAARVA